MTAEELARSYVMNLELGSLRFDKEDESRRQIERLTNRLDTALRLLKANGIDISNYTEKLGEFFAGNVLRITDPCYDRDTWCAGTVDNVLNGDWEAHAVYRDEGPWGVRVSELIAHHYTFPDADPAEELDIDVGVDSGQAGIFNESAYPERDERGEYGDEKTFYGLACKLTLGPQRAGVMPQGVVASSGFGDGSYKAYVARDLDGKVVAVKVVFIGG